MADHDAVVQEVLLDLYDHFSELADQEDAPFGEFARVTEGPPDSLIVLHQDEEWGVEIVVRPITGSPTP